MKKLLKLVLRCVVPVMFYEILMKYAPFIRWIIAKPLHNIRNLQLIRQNKRFHDIHKGQRCFIVCNGPSINRQDLLLLKNEIVFCVSNGYLHKDYKELAPKYYCIPSITYDGVAHEDIIAMLKGIEKSLNNTVLFTSIFDRSFFTTNNLFINKNINYLLFAKDATASSAKIPDISSAVFSVRTVPVMCILIAMYMGFKEIYLLGTEYDKIMTGRYTYFYGKGNDYNGHMRDGENIQPLCEQFDGYSKTWKQWRYLKDIAQKNNIKIYNATLGGILDEFERVNYEQIFKK